ncbi:MAG TPA: DUF3108 domain-containing protein [Candidatus Acidoferrales bacterium]|nr:DUF3108 domain-containing protein [Candidatus Acidoferrales bacterium]
MNANQARTNRRLARNLALLALLAPLAAFIASARDSSRVAPPASVKEISEPFRAGETLNYRVSWAAFSTAASLQLSVPERRDLFGWRTWHFRAIARTLSPVSSLFPVDDQFDSYTDAVTSETRQYEMHQNELGKVSDQVVRFAAPGEKALAPGPSVVVLAGTRDPVGAIYALRGVDWQRTPEFRAPVYDGHDLYEMRAQRDSAAETVKTASGTFTATRISIRVFQREKEVSAIHFVGWIANDAPRTPVVIQATLPFGALRAELIPARP